MATGAEITSAFGIVVVIVVVDDGNKDGDSSNGDESSLGDCGGCGDCGRPCCGCVVNQSWVRTSSAENRA